MRVSIDFQLFLTPSAADSSADSDLLWSTDASAPQPARMVTTALSKIVVVTLSQHGPLGYGFEDRNGETQVVSLRVGSQASVSSEDVVGATLLSIEANGNIDDVAGWPYSESVLYCMCMPAIDRSRTIDLD